MAQSPRLTRDQLLDLHIGEVEHEYQQIRAQGLPPYIEKADLFSVGYEELIKEIDSRRREKLPMLTYWLRRRIRTGMIRFIQAERAHWIERVVTCRVKPIQTPIRGMTAQQAAWFVDWWAEAGYWLRKARKAAEAAFAKHVMTEAQFRKVMVATRNQIAEIENNHHTRVQDNDVVAYVCATRIPFLRGEIGEVYRAEVRRTNLSRR